MATADAHLETLVVAGYVPAERIRLAPRPGSATENDVLRAYESGKRLCELFDGVLVEKTVGAYESHLALWLAQLIGPFVRANDLGLLLGADGMLRLAPGLVRIPDCSFIAWSQLPGRVFPRSPIPDLHPDLAIEVLSAGNTRAEMHRKLHEYFNYGARLVWYLDPVRQEMRVHTSPSEIRIVTLDDALDGGQVLPGFTLPLAEVFAVPLGEPPAE
jgi:Uma2 family endonuclease